MHRRTAWGVQKGRRWATPEGRFRGVPPAGCRKVGHGGPGWNFRESLVTPCHAPMSVWAASVCVGVSASPGTRRRVAIIFSVSSPWKLVPLSRDYIHFAVQVAISTKKHQNCNFICKHITFLDYPWIASFNVKTAQCHSPIASWHSSVVCISTKTLPSDLARQFTSVWLRPP
jgi:hypothetical protein